MRPEELKKDLHAQVLICVITCEVVGDGNCLYNAISLSLCALAVPKNTPLFFVFYRKAIKLLKC